MLARRAITKSAVVTRPIQSRRSSINIHLSKIVSFKCCDASIRRRIASDYALPVYGSAGSIRADVYTRLFKQVGPDWPSLTRYTANDAYVLSHGWFAD